MTRDVMGRLLPDYQYVSYTGSRLTFRGPKQNLNEPYLAFLGATETFGKFIERPFPDRLAAQMECPPVNLGLVNGGIDAYLNDPGVLDIARRATMRVVQIMGALNLSNFYFHVHPRRNDRLIGVHEPLRRLFPEIDFTEFHYTKAMLSALQRCNSARYEDICRELQDIWLARMTALLTALGAPTLLLWLSETAPPQDGITRPGDPMLIDAELVTRIRGKASDYIELCATPLGRVDEPPQGMTCGYLDFAAAAHVLPPKEHEVIARQLHAPCANLIGP